MTAIDVCLQECSKNCVRTLWTRLKLRVLSHPKVCVYNLCSTLSERNIDSIRQSREMTAVHACPVQNKYVCTAALPSRMKVHQTTNQSKNRCIYVHRYGGGEFDHSQVKKYMCIYNCDDYYQKRQIHVRAFINMTTFTQTSIMTTFTQQQLKWTEWLC